MEIHIQRGEGLTQAIKRQLMEEGISSKQFSGSIWTKICSTFKDDNESTLHGKSIGEQWTSINASVKTIVNDVIKIADTTWNKIKGLFTSSSESSSPVKGEEQQPVGNSGSVNESEEGAEDVVEDPIDPIDPPTIRYRSIDNRQDRAQEGAVLASDLKAVLTNKPVDIKKAKELLAKTDKNSIAYLVNAYKQVVSDIANVSRSGFGKEEVYQYILKPLIDRLEELHPGYPEGLYNGKLPDKNMSLDKMQEEIEILAECIIYDELYTANQNGNDIEKANKTIAAGNKFLAEIANMNPKPEIKSVRSAADTSTWSINLPSGQWIQVNKSDDGTIVIAISHDTTLDRDGEDHNELKYVFKDGAKGGSLSVNSEHWDEDYEYNNLDVRPEQMQQIVEIVRRIFGDII